MTKVSMILAAVAVVVIGGFAFRSFADNASAAVPQVGQQAPEFTLPNQSGTPVSLGSYRGKWVVLYFYPKDMTSGCTMEAHNFEQDLSRYQAANAAVVGVSVDSVKSHQEFCTKDSLTFTLLSDTGKKVVAEYGSLGNYMGFKIANRNTFLINPEGKIVKVWTRVDPAHHSQEVLAALHGLEQH